MSTRTTSRIHAILPWILLGLGVWFAVRGWRAAVSPQGSDLAVYWRAARAVVEGRDPNTVDQWIYPPGTAIVLAPLGLLPLPVAAAIFQALSLAAIAWCARRAVDLVRGEGLAAPAWLSWLPALLVLRLADSNLTNGQVNHFTLALLVAALLAAQRTRAFAAGAWVGAAAAFKVVPGIVSLAFLARRDVRALAGVATASVLGLFALPMMAFGPSTGLERIAGWWHGLVTPYASGGEELLAVREYVPGQSLTAMLYRALAATPATSKGAAGPTAELVAWSPDTVHRIVVAVQLAWVAALLVTLVRSVRDDRAGARLREVCLCMASGLMLAPLVHKAHMVWMLVPYALLLVGPPHELGRAARSARWILVAASALLIGATTPTLLGRAFATTALSFSFVGIGVVCATVALAIDVWAGDAKTPSSTGASARSTA
ncbi:MAG: glycosyltransferase family 87 protein [Planctomycetota bacterium]|nr:glycosyltransferase family 87 protein [Planctomycetota bacterium]